MFKQIVLLVLGLSLVAVGYVLRDKGLHVPTTAALQELETRCGNSAQTTARLDSNLCDALLEALPKHLSHA